MRALVVLLLVALLSLVPVAVCFGHEDVAESEGAEAAEEDVAEAAEEVVDDWSNLLALRSGGLFDMGTKEWTPYVTTPFLRYQSLTAEAGAEIDIDEDTEAKGLIGVVLGLTFNVGSLRDLGVEAPWADHFALNVGPYGRYKFDGGEFTGGIMVSVLATDDGAKR